MRYIALLMCLLMQVSVDAQSVQKLIVGRVLDKEATERNEKPVPFDISNRYNITKVYYFNTVQEGREMCEALNQDTVHLISSAKYIVPDSSGFYKVTLSENGSLVIKVGTASAVLEIVESRKEIVTYVETSHHLGEVTVVGKYFLPDVYCGYPIYDSNILLLNVDVALPAKVGKSNARLILQPYIMDVSKNERIKNLRPYVYDGKQYRMTLLRQQEFNKVIDSLAAYVSDEPLTGHRQRYHLKDTFSCPDSRKVYQAFVNIKLQDDVRQTVYYEKTLSCTSDPRRCRKPFRFLEYPFVPYELNPINYQERPKMECRYIDTTEVYCPLTKEEILDRYHNDSDYYSGKKEFALSEYWHLFNMLETPKELEELYRRAYNYSKTIWEKPWILAANNLAVSYLKRDTVDIDILGPLINYSVRECNTLRTIDGRIIGVDNVEQVVANQLEMYLKKENAFKACLLARMLPDVAEYELIKAFALCVNGYYRESSLFSDSENERCKKVFDLVSNSSPLNKVVMCLAMRRPNWNLKAEEVLGDLPVDDAKTFYLKAILSERKDENGMASIQLLECFKKDKDYVPIAEFDEDISRACFIEAKKNYDRWNIAHK